MAAAAWGQKAELHEKNVTNIKTDISETITVLIFLKKQYAEKEFFEAALKHPRKVIQNLPKEMSVEDCIIGSPENVRPVQDYVKDKLVENGAVRAWVTVKARSIEYKKLCNKSGTKGIFVKTPKSAEEPIVQFPNETLLADALQQGTKLKEAYRGLVTTRKGLAMRTTKEKLSEVRAAVDPENKVYAGVENLNPTCTWTMAAVPKT